MPISDISLNIEATTKGVKSSTTQVKSLAHAVEATADRSAVAMRTMEHASKRMATNTGKNYAASAIGLNPLVRAYVSLAASVFAVETAFNKVEMAAKFTETKDAFQTLAKTFNFDAEIMLNELKRLSGGALTMTETMRAASLAYSSGVTTDQLKNLTTAARRASRAFGVTMEDAYSRIIRGVTKLEPELLDELGLTTRLQSVINEYAKSIGKTVDQLTSYEKSQLFVNKVLEESTKKHGSIDVSVQSNAERLGELKANLIDTVLTISERFIPSVVAIADAISALSSQITIIAGVYGLWKLQQFAAHKEEVIGLTLAKQSTQAMNRHREASHGMAIAAVEAAAAVKMQSASHIANAKAAWLDAGAELKAADAALAKTTGLVTEFKLLGKSVAGFFGKILGFIGGPIGMAITTVLLLADSFGFIGKAWGAVAGDARTLQERIDNLSIAQRDVYNSLKNQNTETDRAIALAEQAQAGISKTAEGYTVLSAQIKDASGELHSFNEIRGILASGKDFSLIISDAADVNTELVGINTKLEEANNKLKIYQERAKGNFLTNLLGLSGDKERYNALIVVLEKYIARLEKAQEVQTKNLVQKNINAVTAPAKVADDAMKKLGTNSKYTVDQLEKLSRTKLGNLEQQLVDVSAQFTTAKETADAIQKSISDLRNSKFAADPKNAEQVRKIIADLEKDYKDILPVIEASRKAISRTNRELTDKVVVDTLKDELKLLKQLAAEEMAVADAKFKDSSDLTTYYSTINNLAEQQFEKEAALLQKRKDLGIINEKELINELTILNSQFNIEELKREQDLHTKKIELVNKDRQEVIKNNQAILDNSKVTYEEKALAINTMYEKMQYADDVTTEIFLLNEQKRKDAIEENTKARIEKEGSIYERIDQYMKDQVKTAKTANEVIKDSFITMSGQIRDTLIEDLGRAFGFIEDKAKTAFQNARQAAVKSYQDMVKAANDAFGLGTQRNTLNQARGLEDIERQRVRDIADLTQKRNRGEIDQGGFAQNLTDINTGVRRAQEDLQIAGQRSGQDLQTEKQNSLLDAQLTLNEALLAAEQEYADSKKKIWTDMYDGLKQTAFEAITQIATQQAASWAWELASEALVGNSKLATKASTATAEHAANTATSASKLATDAPAIFSTFTSLLGPFGPPVAAALIGGFSAMLASAVAPKITAPSISIPSAPKVPTIAKFHTGGLITGSSQEVPITGYKGEGVLNSYNGMKAVGGPQGLQEANSTGKLTNKSAAPVNLTLQIVTPDGEQKGTITIDNFEEFLRNKGSRIMRLVSKDGTILMDKRGIA